jgi:hypothetical protein
MNTPRSPWQVGECSRVNSGFVTCGVRQTRWWARPASLCFVSIWRELAPHQRQIKSVAAHARLFGRIQTGRRLRRQRNYGRCRRGCVGLRRCRRGCVGLRRCCRRCAGLRRRCCAGRRGRVGGRCRIGCRCHEGRRCCAGGRCCVSLGCSGCRCWLRLQRAEGQPFNVIRRREAHVRHNAAGGGINGNDTTLIVMQYKRPPTGSRASI